jgi:hypothetical protein
MTRRVFSAGHLLKEVGPDGRKFMSESAENPILEKLRQASEGLLYLSETDAPLQPFFWKSESEGEALEVTPEAVGQHAEIDAAQLKTQSLGAFFKPAVTEEDWYDEDEKASAKRFQALHDLVKQELKGVKIFRTPAPERQVFIVGQTEGGLAGLQTTVVET